MLGTISDGRHPVAVLCVAAAILLFAMSGFTTAREMLAVVVALVLLMAVALRERLSGR
jgi:hypothetical protein